MKIIRGITEAASHASEVISKVEAMKRNTTFFADIFLYRNLPIHLIH